MSTDVNNICGRSGIGIGFRDQNAEFRSTNYKSMSIISSILRKTADLCSSANNSPQILMFAAIINHLEQ